MPSRPVLLLGGQGYVGSALAAWLQRAGVSLQSVDLGLRGEPGPAPNLRRAYQGLTAQDLDAFDAVVLLAGHSSVSACDRAPAEAFANNVGGFVDLVHKLRNQKLVFASSISVYVNTGGRAAREGDPLPEAASFYDLHKQQVERYAALAYRNAYALRFGTVSGPSPNLRPELLLNSMVRSALRDGVVRVANPAARRPLLGINDLCRAVEAILDGCVPPGCYNLASIDATVGAAAERAARRFGVPCVRVELPNHYDVRVCTEKFKAASGLPFRDDLDGLIDSLAAWYSSRTPEPPDGP
jgi:nucleoside-diphosphate-sugar epimerase